MKIPVIDADEVARKVVEPNSQGAREIRKTFGSDVFEEDGSLNSSKIRCINFFKCRKPSKIRRFITAPH